MGIPSLASEEDRRQISSSLNFKDGKQAFLKQHARCHPVSQEEKPSQQERQEDVPHKDCQDSREDAEGNEESCPVKEVHHLGELEEEGQGGGDQEEPRQEHQEEPLQSEDCREPCQETSFHAEEVHHL